MSLGETGDMVVLREARDRAEEDGVGSRRRVDGVVYLGDRDRMR